MRTRGYRSLATALPLLTIVGACAPQADDANVVRRTRSALIGPNVVPDSFPDSSVIVTLEDDIGSRCKGTLITPRLILTAAHCVVGTNEEVPKAPLGPHATVYTAIGANGLAVIGNIGRRIPRVSAPVSAADAGLDFGLLEIDAGADSLSQESWDRLFALRIRRPTFAPLAGSEAEPRPSPWRSRWPSAASRATTATTTRYCRSRSAPLSSTGTASGIFQLSTATTSAARPSKETPGALSFAPSSMDETS